MKKESQLLWFYLGEFNFVRFKVIVSHRWTWKKFVWNPNIRIKMEWSTWNLDIRCEFSCGTDDDLIELNRHMHEISGFAFVIGICNAQQLLGTDTTWSNSYDMTTVHRFVNSFKFDRSCWHSLSFAELKHSSFDSMWSIVLAWFLFPNIKTYVHA